VVNYIPVPDNIQDIIMKQIPNIIVLLSLVILLGCEKCEKDKVSLLNVIRTKDISLPIKGGTASLTITTDASQWT
jgi:hypothetical protein